MRVEWSSPQSFTGSIRQTAELEGALFVFAIYIVEFVDFRVCRGDFD